MLAASGYIGLIHSEGLPDQQNIQSNPEFSHSCIRIESAHSINSAWLCIQLWGLVAGAIISNQRWPIFL